MGPRFTVSVHTVPRSTVGAAGFSREIPIVTATRARTATAPTIIWRRRFWALSSGRAISIELLQSNERTTTQKLQLPRNRTDSVYRLLHGATWLFRTGLRCSVMDNV